MAVASFWYVLEISTALGAVPSVAIVYRDAPLASTPAAVNGWLVTMVCETPQSLFSRFVTFKTSRRTWRLFGRPAMDRPTSCDTAKSARYTHGRRAELRPAYSPRCWLR